MDSGIAAHLAPGTPDDSTVACYDVDGVLEDNTGQIVGIEVKATETVRADDFRGLRLLTP